MNNPERTEQLKQELVTLADKYGFKKIILLGQEEEADTKKLICRVNIFSNQGADFDIHDFSVFWEGCLRISQSLRNISNHMAEHLMEKMLGGALKEQQIEDYLKKGGKHAD